MEPFLPQAVDHRLDPRLVSERREGVFARMKGFGRISLHGSMDPIDLLGLGIIGLQVVV
jgi:hypothetical protein